MVFCTELRFTTLISAVILFFTSQAQIDCELNKLECNSTIEDCVLQLQERCGLTFSYKTALLRSKQINLQLKNTTPQEVLDHLAALGEFTYSVSDKHVIIVPPPKPTFIHGIVYNGSSKETIADVEVTSGNSTVYTNKEGFFNLALRGDSALLQFNKTGYLYFETTVQVSPGKLYIINLKKIPVLAEIKVKKQNQHPVLSLKSYDQIKPEENRVPSLGGETDALNNLKMLTGIQNVSFGDPGLIVRGGGPDQNFVMVDGIPVYNTFHILGLYSIFNNQNINNIKVYKDAFPPRFSSRLSSVIDVSLNNGNKLKPEATVDIGLVSSGISVNGPIVKNKLSYSFSARRTYADLLILPVQNFLNRNNAQKSSTNLWYYDLFGKIHYQPNNKNFFELTAYNGGDQLTFNTELSIPGANSFDEITNGDLGWRNNLYGAQWTHIANSKLLFHIQTAYSGYKVGFEDGYQFTDRQESSNHSTQYENGLNEWRSTLDVEYYANKSVFLQGGLGLVKYQFNPFYREYSSRTPLRTFDTTLTSAAINSTEYFAYAESRFSFEGGKALLGFRTSYFVNETSTYLRFQPRIQVIQNLENNYQLRFSLASANQFVHLVPNNNLGLPIDIWLPVTQGIRPLNVTQLSTNLKKVFNDNFSVQTALFSKFYTNILEHRSGINLLTGNNWEEELVSGSGRAYGFESSASFTTARFKAIAAYTFCRSRRTIAGINNNREYFSKYDRPHSINVFAHIKLTNASSIAFNFTYASGNPVSLPTARYVTIVNNEEVVVEQFDEINNYRLPATHHLDVAYTLNREYRKFNTTLTTGVYNVYNQLNPFMVFIGVGADQQPTLKLRSYLPMMPILKYTIHL
jgi:hypothetical protein